jgi:hypothetical protein
MKEKLPFAGNSMSSAISFPIGGRSGEVRVRRKSRFLTASTSVRFALSRFSNVLAVLSIGLQGRSP